MSPRTAAILNVVLWGMGLYGVFHIRHSDEIERFVRAIFRSPAVLSTFYFELARISIVSLWCLSILGIVACAMVGPMMLLVLIDALYHEPLRGRNRPEGPAREP